MQKLFITFFLFCGLAGASAHAAEVWCETYDYAAPPVSHPHDVPSPTTSNDEEWVESPCLEGLLRGAIIKGDYEKIFSLFRSSHPLLWRFSLISPGISVEEAMRIGRLFRKYMITAVAPVERDGHFVLWPLPDEKDPRRIHPEQPLCDRSSDCICASACALIWFGSPDRFGTVGLHRPRTDDPAFRTLGPADASTAYVRMLANVRAYLEEMEVPKQLIESMVATGSAEMRWVDSSENNVRRPPSLAEWEDASCGAFTYQENKTLEQLVGRANQSQQESLLFNLLLDKYQKKERCVADLISDQKARQAPP
jgi:hypothetical protein